MQSACTCAQGWYNRTTGRIFCHVDEYRNMTERYQMLAAEMSAAGHDRPPPQYAPFMSLFEEPVPQCLPCPEGTFSGSEGAVACKSCAAGSYVTLDASEINGFGAGLAGEVCVSCPAGRESTESGSDVPLFRLRIKVVLGDYQKRVHRWNA